ncbi:MoaD/ThiS family protein [Picrophilus oshimae]|uniref:Sulfur carrier protein ThiS (Thiamine biosynthesis) n=1 Tax=Picrophilus torridus (strain ATCC 700027 / DSM 9790 / JCM 10055 / NBRC 100828 / KAW 2/3) TaxID=1122961 RepID=Q6L1N0_PICTO|nr:MoaD/ThiS family protein [Picrophilus oshimae]AAT43122.1 hypothetical protein PTO0537 [Picrophilus oshimae DSM 9789]SMD30570.1 Sulfur carrier protein ThiS (thiamine biosynthesis) [Picrophilus oshimae DSM 9789]
MIRIKGSENKTIEMDHELTINDIIKQYKIDAERYAIILNGSPATEDENVRPEDDLLFLEVFSGG